MQNVTENLELSGDLDLSQVLNKPVQTLRSTHHGNHHCFSMQHLFFSYKLPQATSQYSFFSCYWHNTSLPMLHHHTLQEVFQTQWSLIIFLDVVLHQPCTSLIRNPWSYSVQSDVNMKYRSLYCTEKRSWETAKTALWDYEEQQLTFEASLGDILIFLVATILTNLGLGHWIKLREMVRYLSKDGKDRYTGYLKTMKTSKQVYYIQ